MQRAWGSETPPEDVQEFETAGIVGTRNPDQPGLDPWDVVLYLDTARCATMVPRREVPVHHFPDKRLATRKLPPHTPLGRRSVGFTTGSVLLFGVFFLLIASGQKGGDSFFSNLWLSGTILPAAGLALAGGAVGAVAVVRDRERSMSVFAAVLLGLVVLMFILGELVFPH